MSKQEQGSIAVLTATAMVVLIGLMALGADIGVMLVQRAAISRATDAAALAGVLELPEDAWGAQTSALDFGTRNGLAEDEMTVTVLPSNQDITVETTRMVPLFFSRIFGIDARPVSVKAQAHISTLTGVRGVVPLGIYEQQFVYGEQYMLKYGSQPGDGVYKGNFGCLALGGSGGSTYRDNLMYGYSGMLRVGDTVETETGNMAGPTADGISYRVNSPANAGCSFEKPNWHCPRVVIVPVIEPLEKGGRSRTTVVGFAALYVEAALRNGADNYVVGRFLQMVTKGEGGDTTYYGLRTSRLVE